MPSIPFNILVLWLLSENVLGKNVILANQSFLLNFRVLLKEDLINKLLGPGLPLGGSFIFSECLNFSR